MSQTNSKRTARHNLAVRFVLTATKVLAVVAAIVVLAAGGLYAYLWYQPLLLLNPVSNFAHAKFLACRDGHQCPAPDHIWDSMIPEVFAVGDPSTLVLQRLRDAGFKYWLTNGPEVQYRMGAGMYHLLCYQFYNVTVTFDASDRLETARSSIRGTPACV